MRIFIFLLFLPFSLFSCALCASYAPSAHVNITIDTNQTHLTKTSITWVYSAEFIETLYSQYDNNANRKFEPTELAKIEKALLDYIHPKAYLTTLKYYAKDTNTTFDDIPKIDFSVTHHKTFVENNQLQFSYEIPLNIALSKEYILYVDIYDDGAYMNFMTNPEGVFFNTPNGYKFIENANYNMLFLDIVDANKTLPQPTTTSKSQETDSVVVREDSIEEKKINPIIERLSIWLSQTTSKIRSLLLDIKYKESWGAFISLLLFSFVYGVIHALGPGHGKALVSSYFLSSNRDVKRAFFISVAIGIVHTFSALIMTIIVYLFLKTLLSTFMDQAEFYLTKVSAVIILLMGAYLLYRRFPKKPKGVSWSTHAPACGCGACQKENEKADLGVILGAGIVPCPTTVLIFIFTISMGMYLSGFLSALFMSAGMSLVIFVAAAMSVKVREKSDEKFKDLANLLGLIGIGIIMTLGVMMLML